VQRIGPSRQKLARLAEPCQRRFVTEERSTPIAQRTLPVAMLVLALVAVPVLVLQPQGLPRLRSMQRELDGVEEENADLRREIARLRVEVRELRDDPAAVERIARVELGMVRRSEVVFQFGR
jgi:cell division protein FtsB